MITTERMARAESERGELVLRRRAEGDLELRVNGVFVMDTLETSSERALASEALARHAAPDSVLIGGLGLGFTLAEVLADDRVRRVVVAEIEPALVEWLRDGTVPHGPALLADPHVDVVVDDVAQVLAAADAAYDVVLLDVDNGPGYLVHDANAALYGPDLLAVTRRALRPDGVCVIWSSDRDEALHQSMAATFGHAEATAYDVDLQGRPEQYWIHWSRVRSRA